MPGAKGKSGRHRKPTAELEILGSSRAKARKKKEPPPLPGTMSIPADYSDTERGIWAFHTEMLANNQVLSATDFIMLDQLVRCYSEYLTLEAFIKENGLTYTDPAGFKRIFPEVRQRNDTRKELRALSSQFGLSPASRSGVERIVTKEQKNSIFTEIT